MAQYYSFLLQPPTRSHVTSGPGSLAPAQPATSVPIAKPLDPRGSRFMKSNLGRPRGFARSFQALLRIILCCA
jgi:hypothetical protein